MNPSLKVLIVDDSMAMRHFVQRILAAAGFSGAETYFAEDGKTALEMLQECLVDIVITDINMPGLDGEGLMACMAQDEHLRAIPVLVMTSDSTATRAIRMLRLGARGYIVKPFHAEELKAEMDRILEASHA